MQPTTDSNPPTFPPPSVFFGVSLVTAGFFALWSYLVFGVGAIQPTDESVAEHWHLWTQHNRGPMSAMIFLTEMGGVAGMAILTAMGALWQGSLKNRWLVVAWIVLALGGGIVNSTTKAAFKRARPANHAEIVHERNFSYPSGHSMGSAVGYGLLGYTLLLTHRRWSLRFVIVLVLTALVGGIGFSRMFLRAHWFSDVIAGWTLGVCWLTFCIGWLERYRRKSA